jgi:acetate kinase
MAGSIPGTAGSEGAAGSGGLVLVLNSGSSSVKFALLTPDTGERVLGGRGLVLRRLGFLGLTEDPEANAEHGRSTGGRISRPGPAQALVVPTDEELMIARDTARLIAARPAAPAPPPAPPAAPAPAPARR